MHGLSSGFGVNTSSSLIYSIFNENISNIPGGILSGNHSASPIAAAIPSLSQNSNFYIGSRVQIAGFYNGVQIFGDGARQASRSRLGTDRGGGTAQAIRDLDYIARLNGAIPPTNVGLNSLPSNGWISFIGPTQTGIRHEQTGIVHRWDEGGHRIEIPPGAAIAPGIFNDTGMTEVVHYNP
jgi:hypothetical protein